MTIEREIITKFLFYLSICLIAAIVEVFTLNASELINNVIIARGVELDSAPVTTSTEVSGITMEEVPLEHSATIALGEILLYQIGTLSWRGC